MSDTPRTDAKRLPINSHTFRSDIVFADFARELERELAEERAKLTQILTDASYEGGVQFWIQKHDALLLRLAQMELGQTTRTEFNAVAQAVEGDSFTR